MAEHGENKALDRFSIAASGLLSGGAAVGLALFIAATANSLALWADWIATSLYFLAVLIAWWGLKKSEAGRTDAYHYGFGRFESLTSMAMAALMVISFLCITGVAFFRFQNPVAIKGMGVLIGMILHVIFGFINVRIMFQSLQLERREKTALVTAQRRLFTIKAGANLLMFGTLCISFFFVGISGVPMPIPLPQPSLLAHSLPVQQKYSSFLCGTCSIVLWRNNHNC
jgi:divalent metal cation (Fe/Co/Zn/Cd) transporter